MLGFRLMLFTIKLYSRKDIFKHILEQISQIVLLFPLLTLKQMLTGFAVVMLVFEVFPSKGETIIILSLDDFNLNRLYAETVLFHHSLFLHLRRC